jgi:predicted aconitase
MEGIFSEEQKSRMVKAMAETVKRPEITAQERETIFALCAYLVGDRHHAIIGCPFTDNGEFAKLPRIFNKKNEDMAAFILKRFHKE